MNTFSPANGEFANTLPSESLPLKLFPLGELWLDNSMVCKQLHISLRTLQRWRTTEKIKFSRIGNKIFYNRYDIEEMLTNVSKTIEDQNFKA